MEKIRDLVNKSRATKETLHTKMGTKKDRYYMDLTEGEEIKKNTEKLYKERSS